MVKVLDSYVVDHIFSPEPNGLKITLDVCVCACLLQIPRMRKDCGKAAGMISHFLLFLSLVITRTLWQKSY